MVLLNIVKGWKRKLNLKKSAFWLFWVPIEEEATVPLNKKTHCLLWFVSCKSAKINIAPFYKKGENKQGYPRVSWDGVGGRRIRVNIFFWYVPCNLPGPWYNWVGVGEGNIISNNPFRGVQKKIRGLLRRQFHKKVY